MDKSFGKSSYNKYPFSFPDFDEYVSSVWREIENLIKVDFYEKALDLIQSHVDKLEEPLLNQILITNSHKRIEGKTVATVDMELHDYIINILRPDINYIAPLPQKNSNY